MKREIKFRAWDNQLHRMITPEIEKAVFVTIDGECCVVDYDIGVYKNLNVELMQFTGLKDNNGDNSKEVYGGDILYNSDRKEYQEVLYNEEKARWDVRYSHGEQRSLADAIGNLNIVVGNKFENPELLKL